MCSRRSNGCGGLPKEMANREAVARNRWTGDETQDAPGHFLEEVSDFPWSGAAETLPSGRMKYSGKARWAAIKLIVIALLVSGVIWVLIIAGSVLGAFLNRIAVPTLSVLWVLFTGFTLYFFRDPEARVPAGPKLAVSPGHGKVDVIDTLEEPQIMGGKCQRISIFLSVLDVHVQNAPVGGRVAFSKYSTGEFLNALRTESASHNENLLLGFEASEPRGTKIGVRMIAGAIARRIVPFVQAGEEVARGQRIGLIQFGSRLDVYLPLSAKINVRLGARVVGGETVLATFE